MTCSGSTSSTIGADHAVEEFGGYPRFDSPV